ncbi:hypothetical protein EDB85DRAFT_217922 [Lactarius pseudohatsudake]|nr:hypothetical protein EDB85DRAFT_217922 [Lactarius pseudohatsudake]
MVNIHLDVNGSQVLFLTIPLEDVQRLSIRPFKWLRFVVFSICGARGELSAIPNGHTVDYNTTTELVDTTYYYKPLGDFIFIDLHGLNDRKTPTTDMNKRTSKFRESVMARDKLCVITQESLDDCDAAHLIPKSKGNDYIQKVIEQRSPLYGHTTTISGIDAIENGVFLSKTIHSKFGRGDVAFLKTPNIISGLDHTDIPILCQDPADVDSDHITLQQLKKHHNDNPVLLATLTTMGALNPLTAFSNGGHVDAKFRSTGGGPLPPSIILDYIYGIAAYQHWGNKQLEGRGLLERYYEQNYAHISASHPEPPSNDDNGPPSEEQVTLMTLIMSPAMTLLPTKQITVTTFPSMILIHSRGGAYWQKPWKS